MDGNNFDREGVLGCGTSVTLVGGTTLVIVSLLHVAHVHGPDSDTFFTSLMFFDHCFSSSSSSL